MATITHGSNKRTDVGVNQSLVMMLHTIEYILQP